MADDRWAAADAGPGIGPEYAPLGLEWTPPEVDITKAHISRVYDFLLGGKDNFPVDREAADGILAAMPSALDTVRENRRFLGRAVRYLTTHAGIRQYLDIGTGIPTAGNTHEIAQTIAPTTRVVYVDNDPIVLTHSRALLTSTPEGTTTYLDADFRDPHTILTTAHHTLDFTQPIAVMLVALLHFVPDEDVPANVVKQLMDAMPPGSYLALSHFTADFNRDATEQVSRAARAGSIDNFPRGADQIEQFFAGMTMVPPGLVPVAEWHNDQGLHPSPADVPLYAGVAHKK